MSDIQKSKKTIIILIVLLTISIGYIGVDKYKDLQEKKVYNAYQNGYTKGIQEAVISLYQQTNNCKSAMINIGNISRQVFDVACLQNVQQS